jgi:hypothetical protein
VRKQVIAYTAAWRNNAGEKCGLEVRYFEHTPSAGGYGSFIFPVRNLTKQTVILYFVNWQGELQQFNTIPAGESIDRHSYIGHRWEAHSGGKRIATFLVPPDAAWDIKPPER